MKPGSNPTLLICLLNATLPLKYRPAVQVDPVAARDTLSELRQLASSGVVAEDLPEDQGAAAIAEAERLLGSRTEPGPGLRPMKAEHWESGETAESGGNGPKPGDQEPDGATAD